jgi:hypothetical protein
MEQKREEGLAPEAGFDFGPSQHPQLKEGTGKRQLLLSRLVRDFDLSEPLSIGATEFLRLGRVVLIFLQAEPIVMEQRGLFFFEVRRGLLDTKFFVVLACHDPPEHHAHPDPQ